MEKKNKTTVKDLDYDLLLNPQNFSLKSEYWDSSAESKIYNILTSYIDSNYIILPHVAFTDVFTVNKNKLSAELEPQIYEIISKYHFDFVVFDKLFLPVLFIEINGTTHLNKTKIDAFKRQLISASSLNGLQLIEIDLYDQVSDDELPKLIEKSLYGNITSRNKYPAYCWQCRTAMSLKQNRTTREFFYLCPNCKSQSNIEKNKTVSISKIPPILKGLS